MFDCIPNRNEEDQSNEISNAPGYVMTTGNVPRSRVVVVDADDEWSLIEEGEAARPFLLVGERETADDFLK